MSLPRVEAERFAAWLNQNTALGDRAVKDVLSRLRRVMVMVDPLKPGSREELVYHLSEQPLFLATSASVRSQLKRAAMLYREFKEEVEANQ